MRGGGRQTRAAKQPNKQEQAGAGPLCKKNAAGATAHGVVARGGCDARRRATPSANTRREPAGKRANKPAAPGQQHLVGARLKKKQVPRVSFALRRGRRAREAVCAGAVSRAASRTLGFATSSRERAYASFLEPVSMLVVPLAPPAATLAMWRKVYGPVTVTFF